MSATGGAYVSQPMFTYLGNKRKLLSFIESAVLDVKRRLNKDKLVVCDGFAGSTVVSRMLAAHASEVHTNDTELYSYVAAKCFLKRPTPEQAARVHHHVRAMNELTAWTEGVVSEMYAPRRTADVQPGERCYFTRENALRIDTWRRYIDESVEPELRDWTLGPVLVEMSIHANTMGHFKAFMKSKDGIGRFSTSRVTEPLKLTPPVFNPHECDVVCHRAPANDMVRTLPQIDLMYFDPPYNQHEYSAYYFLLNVVVENRRPTDVNAVTGLPKARYKSPYNAKREALEALTELMSESVKRASYVLVSYNNEGTVSETEWLRVLAPYRHERMEQPYKRYTARGKKCSEGHNQVVETLYLVWAADKGAKRARESTDSDSE